VELSQIQVHFAVLADGDTQETFLSALKITANGGGLVVIGGFRDDLHSQVVSAGRYLRGMNFMPFDVMKHAEVLFVGSF